MNNNNKKSICGLCRAGATRCELSIALGKKKGASRIGSIIYAPRCQRQDTSAEAAKQMRGRLSRYISLAQPNRLTTPAD